MSALTYLPLVSVQFNNSAYLNTEKSPSVLNKSDICVVNRYDPKRPEKIKDMVLQRICAAGVEP